MHSRTHISSTCQPSLSPPPVKVNKGNNPGLVRGCKGGEADKVEGRCWLISTAKWGKSLETTPPPHSPPLPYPHHLPNVPWIGPHYPPLRAGCVCGGWAGEVDYVSLCLRSACHLAPRGLADSFVRARYFVSQHYAHSAIRAPPVEGRHGPKTPFVFGFRQLV